MKRAIILATMSVICLLQFGWGQVPQTMSYQGILKDDSGNLMNDSKAITFRLYDAFDAATGSAIWSEQLTVQIDDGVFSVILGETDSLPDHFPAPAWLGIDVGATGEELLPRTQLTSAPYSLRALAVLGADNVFPGSGNVGIGTTSPAKKLEVGGTVQLRGHPDNIGLYVDVDGSVGIGTQGLPMSALEVAGTITATAFSGDGSGLSNLPGTGWSLTGNSGTTAGTHFLGTTNDQALELHVNKARALRLEPNATSPNIIGGHSDNNVISGVYGATIGGGGGSSGIKNQVADHYGTVAGGYENQAGNDDGYTGDQWCATVGGGYINIASGSYATVPGGYLNEAAAFYSFAAGQRAKANHGGTFVWADSSINADFASTAADQFLIRASGGVGIGTTNPQHMLDVIGDIRATGSVYYGGSDGTPSDSAYAKPDYVFEDGYEVMTTEEVEKYLKKEGHLPWMTSVKQEREENGEAIDMTRMAFETVETAENLQIHIIELTKLGKEQQREIEALKAAVAALRLSSGQALEAQVKVAARE